MLKASLNYRPGMFNWLTLKSAEDFRHMILDEGTWSCPQRCGTQAVVPTGCPKHFKQTWSNQPLSLWKNWHVSWKNVGTTGGQWIIFESIWYRVEFAQHLSPRWVLWVMQKLVALRICSVVVVNKVVTRVFGSLRTARQWIQKSPNGGNQDECQDKCKIGIKTVSPFFT